MDSHQVKDLTPPRTRDFLRQGLVNVRLLGNDLHHVLVPKFQYRSSIYQPLHRPRPNCTAAPALRTSTASILDTCTPGIQPQGNMATEPLLHALQIQGSLVAGHPSTEKQGNCENTNSHPNSFCGWEARNECHCRPIQVVFNPHGC